MKYVLILGLLTILIVAGCSSGEKDDNTQVIEIVITEDDLEQAVDDVNDEQSSQETTETPSIPQPFE
ncbi:hypothetical protein CMO88_03545 [Candidatus Woesearchaeota archaeon]|nr:hypothetical protein [Candidatus Woesearchaeota archaeon]|tara:strand:+ start:8879 stop:9079 length:201 start_codon:yes stop_codon:yes gene_type:complete